MTDAKEYTEEEIRDSFNSGHTCGMEQGEELGRKHTIDRVLEIIDSKKVDVGYIDTVGLDEYMHRLGWNDALAIVKVAVLALKGGGE